MSAQPILPSPTLNPALAIADDRCALWLAQVTLRLRREIAWCRRQRGGTPDDALPPFTDPAQDSLDLTRFEHDRRAFFAHDVTARYLGDCLAALAAPRPRLPRRGDWDWLARECALTPAAQFVLACALASRIDAALGAVCASCLNDAARPFPTLALAQRLWDEPLAIAACADPGHPLFRHGLLQWPGGRDGLDWQQPLEMPALVARLLLDAETALPGLADAPVRALPPALLAALARLRATPPLAMQVVPLLAPRGSAFAAWAASLAAACGRQLMVIGDELPADRSALAPLATTAWLRGADLLLPAHWQERCCAHPAEPGATPLPLPGLPLRWYLPVDEGHAALRGIPASLQLPAIPLPALDSHARGALLAATLPDAAPALRAALPEAARRFRLTEQPLLRAAAAAAALPEPGGVRELHALLRAEARLELEGLAQPVTPRFTLAELVLPANQARQLREIVTAMRSLGRVHHDWGTAQAWNESGLSVLFCGPPGTGKTMAAEALAADLELPMVRVDLSQVVNKYIGETEKNLRRIFDAAETSDCLIFFDEADALFGKRTEVRDAHDRFANIEIAYLLERMERFKGLAVLASNRRKDLDEAFTRRLRHIVEFPMPGAAEREQLWRQAFPPSVDIAGLDCRWLAQQFEFAGGHIRSAAFNACLLAAGERPGAPPKVAMSEVVSALRGELGKLGHAAGRERFGRYASLLGEPP